MNIVEIIEQLPNDIIVADENFNKLKGALEEYHRLVQEGILIPRGNNVQNIYTTYSFEYNFFRKKQRLCYWRSNFS